MGRRKKIKPAIRTAVVVFPGGEGFRKQSAENERAISERLSKAWDCIRALHDTTSETATRDPWRAYQRAVINLVREHKKALYASIHVRRCIDHAVLAGDKEFFIALGKVLQAGVGLDKRIEKQFSFVREADRLHRRGMTWSQVTDRLNEDPQTRKNFNSDTIRRLVDRYKKAGLI